VKERGQCGNPRRYLTIRRSSSRKGGGGAGNAFWSLFCSARSWRPTPTAHSTPARIAEQRNDVLSQPLEALLLGTLFAVGSLPVRWAIVGRILIPIPTLFLYLSVFLGKNPPLPFPVAFVLALVYAAALTTLSVYLGGRPDRPRLGSRRY
jgi:hypothetical protein